MNEPLLPPSELPILENHWPIEPGFLPDRAIIGGDDRRQVPATAHSPYCAICHLTATKNPGDNYGFFGTGFLITPSVIITAAHCVFDMKTKQFYKSLSWVAGRNYVNGQDVKPFGTINMPYSPTSVFIDKRFQNNLDRNYDIAVVRLPSSFNINENCFSYGSGPYDSIDLTVAGYPFDKHQGSMWRARGKMSKPLGNLAYHEIDAVEGESGGPLIATRGDGSLGNAVYAMHIAEDPKTGRNVALAFTQDIVNLIRSWV